MNLIKKILPHVCIILSGIILIFAAISQFNNAMGYLGNDTTRVILFFLSVIAIIVSCMLIARQRKEG